jgi:hypothetical protein
VKDEGANQRDCALALRKYGVCDERTRPYDKTLLNVEPSRQAYEKASTYTVVPLRIHFDLDSIQRCLFNQIPVIFDVKLIENVGRQIKRNN